MHQSTVCRSLQLMQQQFQLLPRRGAPIFRHGHNTCLHHLRLAYREHRLMAGLIRLGTDLLHQSLLHGVTGVQLVPPRFRSAEHWAELVNHGLLDGAIVSSFCLEQQLLLGQTPKWDGLTAMPLGQLAIRVIALVAPLEVVVLEVITSTTPAATTSPGAAPATGTSAAAAETTTATAGLHQRRCS